LNIKLQEAEIAQVGYVKYLGAYLDSHLKWNKHLEYLEIKLSGAIGVFSNCAIVYSKNV